MADTKRCSKCQDTKPLDDFDVDRSKPDGKHLWCQACKRDYERARGPRAATKTRLLRNRARTRAAERLKDAHADDFQRLYDEEYAKALAEHDELVAVAAVQVDGHAHAAPALPRLMTGPVPGGQTRVDRLREDVGTCSECIGSHDRGHVCPACGARPDQRAEPTPPPPTAPPAPGPRAGLAYADFPALHPEHVDAAARTACGHATDPADALLLLDALGLTPQAEASLHPERTTA